MEMKQQKSEYHQKLEMKLQQGGSEIHVASCEDKSLTGNHGFGIQWQTASGSVIQFFIHFPEETYGLSRRLRFSDDLLPPGKNLGIHELWLLLSSSLL